MVKFENSFIKLQAIGLWNEAFGDSEEYIGFFLDTHCSCTCLALTENNELTSALYLIDGELCGEKGYYLFAAATFKKHRGKGCMAELLKKAEDFAKEKGKSFIALVPAEKSLFDYYSRFGYRTAFYAKKQPLGCEINNNCCRFVWCSEHIDYIKAEHKKYSTDIYQFDSEIYSVFDGGYIKVPAEKSDEYRYGMLLPLSDNADKLTEFNSYIGLTLE